MMYRSFVDLVFIILCAVIVVLAELDTDVLKGLDANPADVGSNGAHSIAIEEMQVLVVSEDFYTIEGVRFVDISAALQTLAQDAPVVVVPESSDLSHERVIAAWWQVHQTGRHVELGVRTETDGSQS